MDIIYNLGVSLGSIIIGYFIGAFPTAIILGKVLFKQDPRDFGSKNAGGTNAGRIWGIKIGLIVMIVDVIKSIIALWLVFFLIKITKLETYFSLYQNGILFYYLASFGATLGHCYPVYAKFKGGKAVSTVAGFIITTSWFVTLLGLIFFAVLKWKKIVSLSSLVSAVSITLAAWFMFFLSLFNADASALLMWGKDLLFIPSWEYALIVLLMAVLIFIRHKENITRLKNNEEPTVKWMK